MSRTLYPRRDTMRVTVGINAAKFIAALVLIGAGILAPDALVSMVVNR